MKNNTETPPRRTLRGLDWLNFLLADVQTGVGPFLAIYLARFGWNEELVGTALAVGGMAGIIAQTPAGALVDGARSKRALIAAGIIALGVGALVIAVIPKVWPVLLAQALIGASSSIFIPAICAISLGIVGHRSFDRRQGRNQTFNSAGNVMAAVSMGLLAYFVSDRAIFFFVMALAIPTLWALARIRADDIDYELARGAGIQGGQEQVSSCQRIAKRPRLGHIFDLRRALSLCECRDAAAPRGDAGQRSRPSVHDVHVGLRRDHAAHDHAARLLGRGEGGGLGTQTLCYSSASRRCPFAAFSTLSPAARPS